MFHLIGNCERVELWDHEGEIPVQLQNELLKLSLGLHLFAVGDFVLGWGYAVSDDSERNPGADAAVMQSLEEKYADVRRVTPMPKNPSRPSITYH